MSELQKIFSPMNFSEALIHLKYGEKVTRDGWYGRRVLKGGAMYVYLVPVHPRDNEVTTVDTFVMQTPDGEQVAWSASQTDLLATDWFILGKIDG